MKFLRFLSLAASVILAFYSALPNSASPFMHTVYFGAAILFLLLFALLTTISRAWERMVGMACIILLICLSFIPVAIFQSLPLTEIFGVEELAAVEHICIKPSELSSNNSVYDVIWIPNGSDKIVSQTDPVTDGRINVFGGSTEFPVEYATNVTVQNFWKGESRELPFYSVEILFTDGYEVTFYRSDDAWKVTWNSKSTDAEWLDGLWLTSAPVTELFDPQVLEEINSIFAAS